MFPISYVRVLKIFIKIFLHSCSSSSLILLLLAYVGQFWPFFCDVYVPWRYHFFSFELISPGDSRSLCLDFMASKWVERGRILQGTSGWCYNSTIITVYITLTLKETQNLNLGSALFQKLSFSVVIIKPKVLTGMFCWEILREGCLASSRQNIRSYSGAFEMRDYFPVLWSTCSRQWFTQVNMKEGK